MKTNENERAGLPSASAAARWMECPASIALERAEAADDGERPSTPAAEFGINIHAALSGAAGAHQLSTAEAETLEKFRPLWARLMAQYFPAGADRVIAERRLWLRGDDLRPLFSGRLDCAVISRERVAVIEYKTLGAPAPAHINWQLRAQAVLLADEHPELIEGGLAWTLAIMQPNASPNVSVASATPGDISVWRDNIIAALRAGDDANAPAMPGRHCAYCRARAGCRAALSYSALAMSSTMLPALAALDEKAFRADAVQRWAAMTPGEKAARLIVMKLAAAVCADVVERAKSDLAADPDALGGHVRLAPGRVERRVKNAELALERLHASGVGVDALMAAGAVDVALGAAEVAFANARQAAAGEVITRGCPERYRAEFNGVLGDALENRQQKPTLVFSQQNTK